MIFPAVRHEVSFWRGQDRLCGDLRLPGGAGPHPVVLVVRELADTQRDYSPWLDSMADAGIASFTWDRPDPAAGAASAAGAVGYRAREVLAAVDRLTAVADLDRDAVALMGWGEGGWAAAQATTFSDRVRALILACTPVSAAPGPVPGYDVRPTLSAVRTPVLALFGEQDPVVELAGSVRAVREAWRDGGQADGEVAIVRGADHALRVRPSHGLGALAGGRHRFGDWPAGLTDLIVSWLHRQLRPEPVPSYAPPLHAPAARTAVRSRTMLPPAVPVRQVRRRVSR